MSNQEIIRTGDVLVRIMTLAPAGATEWHLHTEVHDFFVCLEGTVQVETRNPDRTALLLPGQRTEVAPRTAHRVLNAGGGTAEYLLVQGVGAYDFCPVP